MYKFAKPIMTNFIPKHRRTLAGIIKWGSLMSMTTAVGYGIGLYGVNRYWNFYERCTQKHKIKARMVDMYLIHDEVFQEEFLLKTMQFFELPDVMVKTTEKYLETRKQYYDENNILLLKLDYKNYRKGVMEDDLDDEPDDEDDE